MSYYEENLSAAFADGEPAAIDARDGEALIHKLCADEAVSFDKAVSLLAWFDENCRSGADLPEINQARAVDSKCRNAFHFLIAYSANQKTYAEVCMAQRVMAMELGYTTAAGADNVAGLAKLAGFKRATVNKCSMNFQAKLGLPIRPGQRSADACANMGKAREKQLKATTTKTK